MLVIGAKGHAKEILSIVTEVGMFNDIYFFDNTSKFESKLFYGFPIMDNHKDVMELFKSNNKFCLGLGNPKSREELTHKFLSLGGTITSIISKYSYVEENTSIAAGVNIMPFASIFTSAKIGIGVLINSYSSVHHDATVGDFSEISPGARILGNCLIGNRCSIGANATILPNISLCDYVVIGAGSVVTKNIYESGVYIGIPAKMI